MRFAVVEFVYSPGPFRVNQEQLYQHRTGSSIFSLTAFGTG